ncbi:MAG: O-antigen ligase family protein, partial [Verrucomicrobia bacterium]|nr:O-antigen ligase family protein [Verrucomicrobiota bacterium]
MKRETWSVEPERATRTWSARTFDGALWGLVFLLPIKFGGLFILPNQPESFLEWWLSSWPTDFAVAAVLAWAVADAAVNWRTCRARFDGWAMVPLVWLAAQWAAAVASAWPQRAWGVAFYFSAAAVFFYAGWWPGREARFRGCIAALTAATVVVCAVALQQHFVTFGQTVRDAERYAAELPAELRERMADMLTKLRQGRVFGTLFYPNALAGYLILVGPVAVCWLWQWLRARPGGDGRARLIGAGAAAVFGAVMLWCLLLTRSKGGFLMLAVAMAAGLALFPVAKLRWRVGVLAGLMAVGAVFFGMKGVQRGVETLEARTDYWKAGVAMIAETPWLGGGPGTFGLRYRELRPAGAEWTRLAHNNYLQQWTDSGVVGFAGYMLLWGAALWRGARRLRAGRFEPMTWAVWVGLAAWAAHNLVDFDLYVA